MSPVLRAGAHSAGLDGVVASVLSHSTSGVKRRAASRASTRFGMVDAADIALLEQHRHTVSVTSTAPKG